MWFLKRRSKATLRVLFSFIAYACAQSNSTNTTTTSNLLSSDSPIIATYSGTQTLTLGPTLTTTVYGATVTVQPVTTVVATLPAGGSLTTISSGSSTDSYYVYSTSLDQGSDASLCYDCCLWPCIVTGAQAAATPGADSHLGRMDHAMLINRAATPGSDSQLDRMYHAMLVNRAVNVPTTCPTAWPGIGTMTIFTTSTLTQCDAASICPSSGWGIIGQTNVSGASTIHTSNANGPTSFVQIPTTGSGPATATSTASSSASPTCPYSPGSTITDYYGSQYQIQCDTVYTNTIIGSHTVPSLTDCIVLCDMYNRDNIGGAQCQGASWISSQANNNCLLFDGSTGTPAPGTYSATLLTPLVTPPNNDTSASSALTTMGMGSIITPTAIVTGPGSYTSTEYGVTTVVSTSVNSNGVTSVTTYDVTTATSEHMVDRLVTTVTVTTVSLSMGYSYLVSYEPGPTQTVDVGAGATVTLHDGPTQTIFEGPTITKYGGTVTQTTTAAGNQGTETITTAAATDTITTTVYLYPSSSSSSSYCRPFPTEYLHGQVPVKKRDRGGLEGLVDMGRYAPMPAPGDKPRAFY